MAVRRTEPPEPDLSPETVAILLAGWSAPDPPEAGPFRGFSGGFLTLYDADNRGFIELWQAHAPFLRMTAKRWGWAPQWELDGRHLYYAEFLVAGGRDGIPDVDAD